MLAELKIYQINCFKPLSTQFYTNVQPINDEELQHFISYVNTIIEDISLQKEFHNDLQRHIGSESNYEHQTSIRISLHTLYRALIEKRIHHGLVLSLVDQATRCTPGLDSALKMYIIGNLRFPQNFEDLLAIVRQNFIQKFAVNFSNDVHAQNQILIMGANLYHTQQSNISDPYSFYLPNQHEIQQQLKQAFHDFYVVFQMVDEIEKIIFETLQHSGYQHEGANDENTTILIEQLFIKIFSQFPHVQNLVESEKNLKAHHPQKEIFDFLDKEHVKAANLRAITTILSQTKSPEFHTQLNADQQATIHEILANYRKTPSRCHEKLKVFLQSQQLYFGSHEMIWENLNASRLRESFKTWEQQLDPNILKELNALFLKTRQIQNQLNKNHHDNQLAFHHYFWETPEDSADSSTINAPMIHRQNIRLAIWKTLLEKKYIDRITTDPFIEKIDEVIALSTAEKCTFFQGTLHFHSFSKEHLYLFEFLGLSKDADSLDVLHRFLEEFWYSHLLNKGKQETLALSTIYTYQILAYNPPLTLLEKFMNIPNELKKNDLYIFNAIFKIIVNPTHMLPFIKSWPTPKTFEEQINFLKQIHHSHIRMEVIKHWKITPKNSNTMYSLVTLMEQKYRLPYIMSHHISFRMNNDEVLLYLKLLTDSDKSNFIQYLIKKTAYKHVLKFIEADIIQLFKSNEDLDQCLPYIHMAFEKENPKKFLKALDSFKVLFAKTTDEKEFKQIILNIPSLFFLETQYLSIIAKELCTEQKICFFNELFENLTKIKNLPQPIQKNHLSRLLNAVESQDILITLLRKHHHLIFDIPLYETIFSIEVLKHHQHELIMAYYQKTAIISHQLLLQTFNLISKKEYFTILNAIFKLKGYILQDHQEKIWTHLFNSSMSQDAVLAFFLDNLGIIQDHTFLLWIMDYFSPTQNSQLLIQGHPHLSSLCLNANHLFQLLIRSEKNTLFNEYLLHINIDSLIDIIFLPRNECTPNAEIQVKTQIYILEFLLQQEHFLKILKKIQHEPALIQQLRHLLVSETELSYLFNKSTIPFFKKCAWLYSLLLMHFPHAKAILQQHYQKHLSHQDLALMLSSLSYIKGYVLTTQAYYFLISPMDNGTLLAFLHEYPIALKGFSTIFTHDNNEFFPYLKVEEKIQIFELMVQNLNHKSLSNIFEHLLATLPKPDAKTLYLKHISTTAGLFQSLKVFEIALEILDINIQTLESHQDLIQSLLLKQKNDILPQYFKIFAKKQSSKQQAQYWLNLCMQLSQTLTHHFQLFKSRNFFWQFHEHLPATLRTQTLKHFIQEYPDFFWNDASFHQLLKAENRLKQTFFEVLVSKVDVSKHLINFQYFLHLYLEIKSKSKSKNYISYKILLIKAYGLKLLDIIQNEEQWITILSLDPTHLEIFETLREYLQSMPINGPAIISKIAHLSYHQILLFNLSKSIFEKCEGRWDLFSSYLRAFQQYLTSEQMYDFLSHHQEHIQGLRFFNFYQFQNWCAKVPEFLFQSEIFELLKDSIIELVNQDFNYLYHFIKFLAQHPNSETPIHQILLHPKLAPIHKIEQILALNHFLSPSFIIQNMLANKTFSIEDVNHSIVFLKRNPNDLNILILIYLIIKNDADLCKIFENPQGYTEEEKLNILEVIPERKIYQMIYQSTFTQDYLKLNSLIISRFKDKLKEKINTHNHMLFFLNPCYLNILKAIEKSGSLCSQEDLEELKTMPEFRDFFETSIINTYLATLMESRFEQPKFNMSI